MVGALAKPALDVGIEFQTFFNIANLALTGKMQLLEAGPFSFAVRSDLGGGTGTNGRDTYFFDAGAVASLAFSDVATVNGSIRYSAWTDKFCPSSTQVSNGVEQDTFCTDPMYYTPGPAQLFDKNPNENRFGGQRIYFGIGVTAAIDRFTSFFLQIEGLPFADQLSYKPRLAFMDAYNGALIAKNDHFVYGMAGISLKF
jgi:hypothetical protein